MEACIDFRGRGASGAVVVVAEQTLRSWKVVAVAFDGGVNPEAKVTILEIEAKAWTMAVYLVVGSPFEGERKQAE